MLRQISDYLFMGSLILLVIAFILYGPGKRGTTAVQMNNDGFNGAITDLQMAQNHKEITTRQDSMLGRILKSYLFWIGIIGIIVSIVLSKI
jgi:hypothetical protein